MCYQQEDVVKCERCDAVVERKLLKVSVCAPPCGHHWDVLFDSKGGWCASCTAVMLEELQRQIEPKDDEKAHYLRKGYAGPKKQ